MNPFACLFQLLEATRILWLVVLLSSSKPGALMPVSSNFSAFEIPVLLKNLYDYTGSIWIIQDNLPIMTF